MPAMNIPAGFFSATPFILLLCMMSGLSAQQADQADIYYYYQHTTYLENLNQPGAWWSNPALLSSIDRATVFTSSTGLLGRRYSISSSRIIIPVNPQLKAGFGLTGSARGEGRSGSGTNSGFSFSSYFNFTKPSIEAGMSFAPRSLGTFGALMLSGTVSETPSYAYDSTARVIRFFWGYGLGWISPALLKTVAFSFSTLSIYNVQFLWQWENCAKAGIIFNVKDSAVLGSLEYGFSLDGAAGTLFSNRENAPYYEVLKGTASIRFRSIAGFILGYSLDTKNGADNGSTYHAGIELRRSTVYPCYGGYEMGLSTTNSSNNVSIIHRFWVGFNLKQAGK
jgi:hypothetical protein